MQDDMSESVYRRGLALPRVSVAGLLLAFALAAVLATVVGVTAWSMGRSQGPTAAQISAGNRDAYARGLAAGRAQASTAAVAKARSSALLAGRKRGYDHGLAVGFKRGRAIGIQLGRTIGYTAGYTAGQASVKSVAPTKKH